MFDLQRHRRKEAGFTLIETLVALVVMGFGVLSLAGMQLNLSRSGDVAKQRTEATRLAQEKVETLRSFTGISSGTLNWNKKFNEIERTKKKPEIVNAKSISNEQLGLYHFQGQRVAKQGFAVQVAALNQRGGMLRKQAELQKLFLKNILINFDNANTKTINYKILIGPFATATEASSYQSSLKKKNITGFIIDLTTL